MSTSESPSAGQIETFPNQYPNRDYTIEIVCPEFTSVCPKTGQPDFGTIIFDYVPNENCVELKSLKLYLQGYRNRGIFYEMAVNQILEDFVAACQPRWAEVVGEFTPRGGLSTTVACVYTASADIEPAERPRTAKHRRR